MIDQGLVKAVGDLGLGLGSLVIMAVLFIYQLKTNQKMMDGFSNHLDENTKATNEMTKTLISMNETNKQLVDTTTRCRFANQK